MKSSYLLVGALMAIAIIAIIKKHFFGVLDYDLPTQGNAIRFGIEGYEDAEVNADAETDTEGEIEGYEDGEDGEEDDDVEHMTSEATQQKKKAKLRAGQKKAKTAKKAKAAPAQAPKAKAAPEKFENTPRFQELKAKWDAYKAKTGPALTEEERVELLALLDMPEEEPAAEEAFEQFEEMPYQGTEYAMF